MPQSKSLHTNKTRSLEYITFPSFEKCGKVRHAFSTRLGGVSEGYFARMNMSFSNGDTYDNVYENYRRLCSAAGINQDDLVFSDQQHTANIRIVDENDKGKGITKERDYTHIDGLITGSKGVPLATVYADCVPLFFCDPVKDVVALAHAGWKGTAARIGAEIVQAMKVGFGSDPADIIAGIAPSIGPCCYEVDDPLFEAFSEIPDLNMAEVFSPIGNGKYMLDLRETNRQILMSAGIPVKNITVTDLCTCCHPDYFHSHRATSGKRGLMCAIIELI